jgi:hypothetical protein
LLFGGGIDAELEGAALASPRARFRDQCCVLTADGSCPVQRGDRFNRLAWIDAGKPREIRRADVALVTRLDEQHPRARFLRGR